MVTYKEYIMAESLAQAYELNQKKSNRVIAGNAWLKLGNKNMSAVIDLSALGLNEIEETEEEFRFGSMVTLRQLELCEAFSDYTQGASADSVHNIVGVQFRNCATLGGSIYGRFGFSDVLTMFLVLDTYVELYHAGIVPLTEFVKMPRDNDILVRIIVKKTPLTCAYQAFRNQATDFPVLTCACALVDGMMRTAIGARPVKAELVTDTNQLLAEKGCDAYAKWVSHQYKYGTNMRAGANYRQRLAYVLTLQNVQKLTEETE